MWQAGCSARCFCPRPSRRPIRLALHCLCLEGCPLPAHRKLEVEVLDALSITASLLRGDYSTAGSVMFLLTVLSAMRECGEYHITVKSGKYLEALAKADTIVCDKTGTLTRATPQVVQVVPFSGCEEQEVLQLAACLEEHFPIPWQTPLSVLPGSGAWQKSAAI